ncbi:UbiA family prenyltransferase, putative [Aspergillus lentulus]|uniref:UbiA family prenyltransferase, putative n=1 Tax=Aspergillus lentulus TaxID=293939 RepID=A0ABQ1A9G3_ASPLE|nr:UbiA family prenyltransferase, putative [Aspergillus lentulus]
MKANTSIQEVMGPNLVLANTTPECHFLPSSKYTIPKTGLFAIMPQSWIPYAELMRLDRPAGYWAFYWHFAIGLALAASMSSPIPSPLILISLFLFFAVWVIVLRGAVCSWNDTLDQSFDRKVSRTRNRPIPRGRGLHGPSPSLHARSDSPGDSDAPSFAPGVILGIAFGMPIFLCGAALDADPLPLSGLYRLGTETDDLRLVAALCFYIASILWTVIFDTIYAHQDARDDANVGVRSLAVRLGDRTKQALSVLAATQVMLLLAAGVACNFSAIYFAGSCVGTAISLAALLWFVDLRHSASCAWWFCPGSHLVGASIVVGLLGEYCVNS